MILVQNNDVLLPFLLVLDRFLLWIREGEVAASANERTRLGIYRIWVLGVQVRPNLTFWGQVRANLKNLSNEEYKFGRTWGLIPKFARTCCTGGGSLASKHVRPNLGYKFGRTWPGGQGSPLVFAFRLRFRVRFALVCLLSVNLER